MFRRREGSQAGQPPPEQIYSDLRSMALHAVERVPIQRRADHPDVYGVVVDIPAQGGHATVVALGDNTTSLYTSTGGGTIGAGEGRPNVAAATHRLLEVVQAHLGSITDDDDGGLPERGSVRLHVLTKKGLRSTDIPEDAFWGRTAHPLTPVVGGVQDVISLLRIVSPR